MTHHIELSPADETRLADQGKAAAGELVERLELLATHRPERFSLYLNVHQALKASDVDEAVYRDASLPARLMFHVVQHPKAIREFIATGGEGIL